MTTMTRIVATVGATGVLLAAAVAPAVAFDRSDLVFAAQRSIERQDLPKSLSKYDKHKSFNANESDETKAWLCGIWSSDPSGDTTAVQFPIEDTAQFSTTFASKNWTGNVATTVYRYSSAAKAAKAFKKLGENAPKCKGTVTLNYPADGDEPAWQSSQGLTNGVVKSESVHGVASVFIHSDFESTSTNSDGSQDSTRNDSYTLYSLAGDAVIATSFGPSSMTDLTKAQINGVSELAMSAAALWLK